MAIPRVVRRGLVSAGARLRLLPVLPLSAGWPVAVVVRHRPHPLGRLWPTAAGLGHRHRRTGPGGVRLPEISDRVRTAPLARRDSGVQRRHRQRHGRVDEPAAVGMAAGDRPARIQSLPRARDDSRHHRRHRAGLGRGRARPREHATAAGHAAAAPRRCLVRLHRVGAAMVRTDQSRPVRHPAVVGEHAAEAVFRRRAPRGHRPGDASVHPRRLAPPLGAGVLLARGRGDVGPLPWTGADLHGQAADLQGAVRLADAHARSRGCARPGEVLGPRHALPRGRRGHRSRLHRGAPREAPDAGDRGRGVRDRRRGVAGRLSDCSSRRRGGRRRRPRPRASSSRSARGRISSRSFARPSTGGRW